MYGVVVDDVGLASRGFADDRVIDEMALAEKSHWWYAGLRDLLARLLSEKRFVVRERAAVLDVGCGTGGNLRLLKRLLAPEHLEGFDVHPRAIELAADQCPSADIHSGDICEPKLHRRRYDLAICCDVISLVGLSACRRGIRQIVERLAPGGLFVLHVPACPKLYSDHDRAVGNIERYRLSEIESLTTSLGLTVELATYRMSLLFPLVATSRAFRRRARSSPASSDLHRGPALLAPLWSGIVQLENRLTARGIRWPTGSSIIAVGRRR